MPPAEPFARRSASGSIDDHPHPALSPLGALRRALPFVCRSALLLPARRRCAGAGRGGRRPRSRRSTPSSRRRCRRGRSPACRSPSSRTARSSLAKGYGLSDVEKSIKATEHTVYQLASVTKPFTAMAALMLVEDGKLSLDGKVTGHPARSACGLGAGHGAAPPQPHVRHQELHRRVRRAEGRRTAGLHQSTEILALVKDAPLQFTPGRKYAYCNTGYYLLGMIIEKVSGKPYATFLAERIFTPLGMTSTALDDYADARPVRAKGYSTRNGTDDAGRAHASVAALLRRRARLDRRRPGEVGRRADQPQAPEAGELRRHVDADAPERRHVVHTTRSAGRSSRSGPGRARRTAAASAGSPPSWPAIPTTRSPSSSSSTSRAGPVRRDRQRRGGIYVPALRENAPEADRRPEPDR